MSDNKASPGRTLCIAFQCKPENSTQSPLYAEWKLEVCRTFLLVPQLLNEGVIDPLYADSATTHGDLAAGNP